MPYEIKKTDSCPASKPFGVFNKNTGDLRGRCHESRAKALAQMRALYAVESGVKMRHSEQIMVIPTKSFAETEWLDGNKKWIKIYPYTSWSHPIFTDTSIDEETASALKDSFEKKVYGDQDIVVTYDHGLDRAKGGKAAGWYRGLDVKDDGLWGLVEFTDEARKEIDAGEWRYFSGEHHDEWKNPHTGETHNLVFAGGAITNKPWVKDGCVPLNFSEVAVDFAELKPEATSPEEFMEPGSNNPDPKINEDNSYPNRLDTPPAGEDGTVPDRSKTVTTNNEGGEKVNEAELRKLLGLDDKGDIEATVKSMVDELVPLRELKKEHSEKKAFAELYPEQAKRLEALEEEHRNSTAKRFSEAFIDARVTRKIGTGDEAKDEPTTLGFSGLAIEKIKEHAKSYSEGAASLDGFKEVLDTIMENGIVDYGNKGSERAPEVVEEPKTYSDARKQFSDLITGIIENDKLEFEAAYVEAAKREPKLFESYKKMQPATTSA